MAIAVPSSASHTPPLMATSAASTFTPSGAPTVSSSLSSSHTTTPSVSRTSKREPHLRAVDGIRTFLESKSCYDILPESFRLIVFDNQLSITRSLQALVTNGVVSAPLYDSTTQRFAGMFTLADVVHLIQYYYLTAHEYENVVAEVEAFRLESLRKIEQAIDVPPPPTISVHPDQPLSDACAALVRTHARRLPLVDRDDQTGKETIVSVLTQYRVLKFIAINCQHDCARLDQSIGSLGIGSYVSWYEPPSLSSMPRKESGEGVDRVEKENVNESGASKGSAGSEPSGAQETSGTDSKEVEAAAGSVVQNSFSHSASEPEQSVSTTSSSTNPTTSSSDPSSSIVNETSETSSTISTPHSGMSIPLYEVPSTASLEGVSGLSSLPVVVTSSPQARHLALEEMGDSSTRSSSIIDQDHLTSRAVDSGSTTTNASTSTSTSTLATPETEMEGRARSNSFRRRHEEEFEMGTSPRSMPPPRLGSSPVNDGTSEKRNDSSTTSKSASHAAVGGGEGGKSSTGGLHVSERYFPLSTATLETSVFDVVHIFSERGISAVPIVDEDGMVLNMYETVDIVDLVRQNAYEVLDKTIQIALDQRSNDFTGVITCTPRDTLASILAYIRERRCHRFVIIEDEDVPEVIAEPGSGRNSRPARKKGSLVGILSLSDVLRYLVGHEDLKGHEVKGLGVHGLRGVGKLSGVQTSPHPLTGSALADVDDGTLSDAGVGKKRRGGSSGAASGSRRGSETTDAGSDIGSASGGGGNGGGAQALGSAFEGLDLGLEDVPEGRVAQ